MLSKKITIFICVLVIVASIAFIASQVLGVTVGSDLNLSGNNVVNIGCLISPDCDAANKSYVDSAFSGAGDINAVRTLGVGLIGGAELGDVDLYIRQDCGLNEILKWDGASSWDCATDDSGGAGGSPGGSNAQVQYNDGGVFGGAASFYYDDVNNRVGIGVGASPLDPLHILTDSGGQAIHIEENSGGENWQIGVDAFGNLDFQEGGSTRITFEDAGNVGINIANPAYRLDVSGHINATGVYHKSGTAGISANCDSTESLIDITTSGGIVTAGTCGSAGDGNDYVDDMTFIPGTGYLTLDRIGGGSMTESLDGRYILKGTITADKWCVAGDVGAQVHCTEEAPVGGDIFGAGVATRVAYFTAGKSIGSDSELYWDNTNNRLGIGVGSSPTYSLDVGGDIGLDNLLRHNDDSDTYLNFTSDRLRAYIGAEYLLDLYEGIQDYVKLGDGGDVDINLNDDVFVRGSDSNVGIGTTIPGAKLEVAGQVKITGGSPGADKVLTSDTAGLASWQTQTEYIDGSGVATGVAFFNDSADLKSIGSDDDLYWDNINKRLGIGMTNPGSTLDIDGDLNVESSGVIYGIRSVNNGTTGVYGSANSYGVYGVASVANGVGVRGYHTGAGYGIWGETGNSIRAGVFGQNTGSGPGVFGRSSSGPGGWFQGGTTALIVDGAIDADDSTGVGLRDDAGILGLWVEDGGNVGVGTNNPIGKLDVNGTIYQRGGLLHADYVFEPGYELESIEEHSEYMWENKHLKAIPGVEIDEEGQEMLEIGAQRRGILEELEKAHVYIQQLNEQTKELKTENNELRQRIEALENAIQAK